MKLNIGAGKTRYPGYVNCDHDNTYDPEYVFDLENDVWPFEDHSVTEVIAHHVLEHMGEGYFHCLKELYRVCAANAVIDIRVPHYTSHYFHHDPTHRRAITPFGLTLFSKKYNETDNGAASKLGQFFNVDFEIVYENYIIDPPAVERHKDMSYEQLIKYAQEHNNIINEIHVQLMVIKGSREEQIKGYYLNILKREADPSGLKNYLNSSMSLLEIRDILMNSDERRALL